MAKHLDDDGLARLISIEPLTASELVKARYWVYRNRKRAGDPNYDYLAARVQDLWPKTNMRRRALKAAAKSVAEDAREFNGGDDR